MEICQPGYQASKKIYDLGLITRYKMFENILIRVSVRLLPNFVRKFVYRDLLRKINSIFTLFI